MLIGTVAHGVDAKGRIFIPAKWRDDLGSPMIITHGILGRDDVRCLFGMSVSAFETLGSRFDNLPRTDMLLQDFRRLLYQNAAECDMDKQGRILLSTAFREYANLDKEATILGVGDHIEIWNAEALAVKNSETRRNYDKALSHLAEQGV